MRCSSGKVLLPHVTAPDELVQVFFVVLLKVNILNNILEVTTMFFHSLHLVFTWMEIYLQLVVVYIVFVLKVQCITGLEAFFQMRGLGHVFLQLYIYDTAHELQNRMLETPHLHQNIVNKLQQILHQCNPFVHVFRQLAQQQNIHECTLFIKECPVNQPQYNLPTASQVATIIVTEDTKSMAHG